MRRLHWSIALALLPLACGPNLERTAGLHLPDGDPHQGLAVLKEMKCHACHRVRGHEELPAPVAQPAVQVVLGGAPGYARSDCELVNAIVHPSHRISAPRSQQQEGELSPMGDFTESMTVRQLVDLVAFLRTLHEPLVAPPEANASAAGRGPDSSG
jgi:hypothetical protein